MFDDAHDDGLDGALVGALHSELYVAIDGQLMEHSFINCLS